MGISLGLHGRSASRVGHTGGQTVLLALAALLVLAALGCQTQPTKQKSTSSQGGGEPKAAATQRGESKAAAASSARPASQRAETQAARSNAEPIAGANHVRLTEKGCVEFEPHWAKISVGQSLVWHSDLKSPVTVHVSPGAFDKTEYVVRAGATVSTGPAHGPGSYLIWTEPTACRTIPRGQDAGPGVKVEGAAAR